MSWLSKFFILNIFNNGSLVNPEPNINIVGATFADDPDTKTTTMTFTGSVGPAGPAGPAGGGPYDYATASDETQSIIVPTDTTNSIPENNEKSITIVCGDDNTIGTSSYVVVDGYSCTVANNCDFSKASGQYASVRQPGQLSRSTYPGAGFQSCEVSLYGTNTDGYGFDLVDLNGSGINLADKTNVYMTVQVLCQEISGYAGTWSAEYRLLLHCLSNVVTIISTDLVSALPSDLGLVVFSAANNILSISIDDNLSSGWTRSGVAKVNWTEITHITYEA
jgi:hypothetical protein